MARNLAGLRKLAPLKQAPADDSPAQIIQNRQTWIEFKRPKSSLKIGSAQNYEKTAKD